MRLSSQRNMRPDFAIILGELSGVTALNGGVGHRYKILIDYFLDHNLNFKVLVFGGRGAQLPASANIYVETWGRVVPWPIRSIYRVLFARLWIKIVSPRVVLSPDWEGLCSFCPKDVPLVTNLVTNLELIHEIGNVRKTSNFLRIFGYNLQMYLEVRQTKRSRSLIAISQALKTWTEARYRDLAPIQVVPNFLTQEDFSLSTADLEIFRDHNESPFLLFVGRLEIRKGILETFEAFAKLLVEFPELNLYLAGSEGDTRTEPRRVELLATLPPEAGARVKFLGNLSKSQLYSAMQSSEMVLTPSRWEGFGNATAEAMAVGAAVVATSGSGFADFCRHGFNSFLVKPNDSEDLATGIRELLRNPELRSKLKRNASKISQTLSVDVLGLNYLKIIESQSQDDVNGFLQK